MDDGDPDKTIPLVGEQVHVSKTDVVTDKVRVTTSVEERAVLVEDIVERGDLHIQRVAVERAVSEAPEPHQDGNTLILSIVEERLVVEKRLFVIEEVRVTRLSTTERVTMPETVRTMRATVAHAPSSEKTGSETNG